MTLLADLFGGGGQPDSALDAAPAELLRRALRVNDGVLTPAPATAAPVQLASYQSQGAPYETQAPPPAAEQPAAARPAVKFQGREPGGMERIGAFADGYQTGGLLGGLARSTAGIDKQQQIENETLRLIMSKTGMGEGEALAIIKNPAIMQQVLPALFGSKAVTVKQGEQVYLPDGQGGYRNVIDNSDSTKPQSVAPGAILATQSGKVLLDNSEKAKGTVIPAGSGYIPAGQQSAVYTQAEKPKDLSFSNIKDLSTTGGSIASATRFASTFKPAYSGGVMGSGIGGDVANAIASRTGVGNEDAAKWWNDYNEYKNAIRHDLFGAALTKNEQAAFDSANITPNMTPNAVRTNLIKQKQAVEAAAKKTAEALIAQRYDRAVVEKALGVSIGDLTSAVESPVQNQQTNGALKPMPSSVMSEARAAIDAGKPRDAVLQRLRQNGYDAAGLE